MRFFRFLAVAIVSFGFVGTGFAQSPLPDEPQAVISIQPQIFAGEPVLLSAKKSLNPAPEAPVSFVWRVGEMTLRGEEVAVTFREGGPVAIRLTMQTGAGPAETSFDAFVYSAASVLISDSLVESQAAAFVDSAREQQRLVSVIPLPAQAANLTPEDAILSALQNAAESIQRADTIVLDLQDSSGFAGLARFAAQPGNPVSFAGKRLVFIAPGSLDTLETLARGIFGAARPEAIVVTRSDAIRELTTRGAQADAPVSLAAQAIPYRLVDADTPAFSWTAPLTSLINVLVARGVPASVVALLLMVPVIATIIAFFKQVVGVTTFGIYTPTILTLSFLAIGSLPLATGLLLLIVFASVVLRKILLRYRLNFMPRMAIVHTSVATLVLITLGLLALAAPGFAVINVPLIAGAVFPLLIMSTLAEKFISLQAEQGARSAVRFFAELIAVVLVCAIIAGHWSWLRTTLLAHAELIIVFLLIDVALGRYTGLRVTEYFRFRELFRDEHEE